MTGKDLIIYILSNDLENSEIYLNDKEMIKDNLDYGCMFSHEDGHVEEIREILIAD